MLGGPEPPPPHRALTHWIPTKPLPAPPVFSQVFTRDKRKRRQEWTTISGREEEEEEEEEEEDKCITSRKKKKKEEEEEEEEEEDQEEGRRFSRHSDNDECPSFTPPRRLQE